MSRAHCSRAITRGLLLAAGLAALPALAEQLPLWEAGAGVAAINFPEYRGSDERQSYVLPLPYFVYRGDFLQVDDQRVRGLFFKNERAEMDVSINGSVPVKSNDNGARRGMPDLDPTLEIGPSLNFFLHRSDDRKVKLDLRLPLRAVLATNLRHAKHAGWIFQPNLNIDVRDVLGNDGWNLGLLAGPVFADRRYHQYLYNVDPAFASADRPAYSASGGYAGSQFIAALSKRFPAFWVGGFMKWDTLQGAVFADSPLVRTRQYFTAGIGVAWVFARSANSVEINR